MLQPYVPSTEVSSISDAVELARQYQQEGYFDLFRGQDQDWPIQPSFFRSNVDQNKAREEVHRFNAWVNNSPGLKSLHGNQDAMLAVAQHYSIPTPLLDWTTNPEVAGFFASGGELGSKGVILCVRSPLLKETWEDENEASRQEYGHDAVRLVEIHVKDLWRIQAQSGVFMDIRVQPNLFEMLGDVHRIRFTHTRGLPKISKEVIYPTRKSNLEILLDQYFSAKDYLRNYKRFLAMEGPPVAIIPASFGDPSYFIGNELPPPHMSWANDQLENWNSEPDEPFHPETASEKFVLRIPAEADPVMLARRISEEAVSFMTAQTPGRSPAHWIALDDIGHRIEPELWSLPSEVQPEVGRLPKSREIPFGEVLTWIWDGMRCLPYSDEQIGAAFGNYLALLLRPNYKDSLEPTRGIEFEAIGKRVRAFCSEQSLVACVRSDFLDLLRPSRRTQASRWFPAEARSFLAILRDPSRLFYFEYFADIYAREIVPAQMLWGKFNQVPIFNPAQISLFGNS